MARVRDVEVRAMSELWVGSTRYDGLRTAEGALSELQAGIQADPEV